MSEQYFKELATTALEKLSKAPGTLDSCDLEQLDILGRGDEGRRAKAAALAPPPAPAVTAAPAVVAEPRDPAGDDADYFTKHAAEAATVGMVEAVIDAALDLHRKVGVKYRALEKRIAALEAKPKGLAWGGIWNEGEAHAKDTLATRSGSLWLAERDTVQQPGSPDSGWRLILKRGAFDERR
jgi:hypothetical protein